MAKVLIAFDTLREGFDELERYHDLTYPPHGRDFTQAELLELIPKYEVLCSVFDIPVSRDLIEAGGELKLIANYAVGYDNIDLRAAAEHGITVTNTPHSVVEPTADLTLALLLGCSRRLCEWDSCFRRTRDKMQYTRLTNLGVNLCGKTIGILGFGNIGAAVARRCKAFGMKVIYCKRRQLDTEAEQRIGITYAEKDALLAAADIVSLHMPLNEETRHYIGARELALMKPGAILINTARGSVVDEVALLAALKEKRIAAAGLDVFEHQDSPLEELYDLSNVCITPHIGTQTYDARLDMVRELCSNVLGFLEGDRPISCVPMPRI